MTHQTSATSTHEPHHSNAELAGDSFDKLPLDLCIDADGHLTEIAATAAADGEWSSLPDDTRHHLHQCPACAHRVGEASLLATRIDSALQQVAAKPVFKLPKVAVVLALVLTVIGYLPSAQQSIESAHQLPRLLMNWLPQISSVSARLSTSFGLVFVAVFVGWVLSRSKKELSQ